ncbi:hypothetical protein [Curtobacterium sp. AB7]|uniref:hypothetical protein n=1 Tax=Curtobacterium sp. AB7 TaxID=3349327 RepID=UPI0038353BC5
MGRAGNHLNDKQTSVLRWVADGAPPDAYPEGDYAHRITAKALASRGLVRVEGHGTSWRATLTDAGASRVAQLGWAPSSPADGAGKSDDDVVDLLHRVEAAGGRLEVDDREDDVDYPKLVWRFNKSERRPRGKELHLSHPSWKDQRQLRLEYRDWFWDLIEIPEVQAVASKSHLGPLAKAFLSNHDDQFVSKESLPRAARVLEAIARHAATTGIEARDPRAVDEEKKRNGGDVRGWSGHLELTAGSVSLRVQIRETPGAGSEKFNYYPDGDFDRRVYDRIQRLPTWQRNRNHAFVPTGRLELRVARPGFSFDGHKLKDTKSSAVEDRLGEIFQHLEVLRRESEEAKRKAREFEDRKKQDWDAAMNRARVLFRASQEESLLVEQASTWRKHQEVAAFVTELSRRDDGSDPALRQWIETGERVARRLDAFGALATPEFPKPTAQDLEPFLDGWSAWGPTHSATPFR